MDGIHIKAPPLAAKCACCGRRAVPATLRRCGGCGGDVCPACQSIVVGDRRDRRCICCECAEEPYDPGDSYAPR